MESSNEMLGKNAFQICGLACILLLGNGPWTPVLWEPSVVCAEQLQLPKDFRVSEYFSFFGSGGIDWRALSDPNNNPIMVACIEGNTEESLQALGIVDLEQRLEKLERGGLIRKADGGYTLAFPAVVGEKRSRLGEYAEEAARKLVPLGEEMIAQIRPHLAGREKMLYHVLWSVVMDGGPAWDAARAEMNRKLKAGDTSTENKAWLLYPSHPFRAGTNSSNNSFGHVRITWSHNTPSPNAIGRAIGQYASELTDAIEQSSALASADARSALRRYGLIDEAGKVRLYFMQANSEEAQAYAHLGGQFGQQAMDVLDVARIADMLGVSPGVAFVIAYHEICWQLLQELAEKEALAVPRIVAEAGRQASEAYQLVSLMVIPRARDPLLETEMSREEAQAIDEFRRIKARILAGDSYDDTSTPLHAALTHFSALKPGRTRDYFMGFDILRAPLPPEKPEEGSLWPVFAGGGTQLQDTFVLAYSKGRWIWMGNMGSDYDWRSAKPTIEKMARGKIKGSATAEASSARRASEAPTPGGSAVNRVLNLDGHEDCVRVADSQSLQSFTDAITIEVWLKASSFYADDWAISSIIRKNVGSGAENFLLRFRNIDGALCAQMGLGEIGTLQAPYEFAVNKWYHLAGTYDGRTITVLVNGLAIAGQNIPGRPYIDQSELYIGRGDPEYLYGECFHGELDEIRIWNVARSQEQIRAAMNTPLTGKEDGLVAYWNFDDGTAKDLSPYGNDGVLHGDAQIVESPRLTSLTLAGRGTSTLVAWWKLDEADGNDVADSSGNGNLGRLIGNPQWQPAGGKVSGALAFDGVGDFVEIRNEPAFDLTGAITIAAWIKVDRLDKRWQAIVTKGDTAWRIHRTATEDTLAFHCTGIVSIRGQSGLGIEGNKSVNDGKWHHVVGVYDGSTISLYIDGALDNSGAASGNIQTNDLPVLIGANSEASGREWNGLIDDVCILCGAIDANGVRALHSGEDPVTVAETATTARPAETAVGEAIVRSQSKVVRTPEKHVESRGRLVAWWKFENNADDSTGTSDGVPHGNPTYVAGKFGQAINLDGDDYVDCGNPSSLNFGTGDWAVSAWMKTTQSGTQDADKGTVFAKGGDGGGGIRYTLAVNEQESGSITLTADDDLSKLQAISRVTVNDGAWHHVVGMREGKLLRLYVDGVLDTTSTLPTGFSLSGASQQNACIGVIADNAESSLVKYFVGQIDEVCVFACALDTDNVKALYSGKDPMTVAEAAAVTLAQASGKQVQDRVGGRGSMITTLILVLALAGLVGAIALFLVRSSVSK